MSVSDGRYCWTSSPERLNGLLGYGWLDGWWVVEDSLLCISNGQNIIITYRIFYRYF